MLNENFHIPVENRTIYDYIRLVDGANNYEGRLEVNISGEFGTVCNDVSYLYLTQKSASLLLN